MLCHCPAGQSSLRIGIQILPLFMLHRPFCVFNLPPLPCPRVQGCSGQPGIRSSVPGREMGSVSRQPLPLPSPPAELAGAGGLAAWGLFQAECSILSGSVISKTRSALLSSLLKNGKSGFWDPFQRICLFFYQPFTADIPRNSVPQHVTACSARSVPVRK